MKKLKLNKETVSILENADQKSVMGGVSGQSGCANYTITNAETCGQKLSCRITYCYDSINGCSVNGCR